MKKFNKWAGIILMIFSILSCVATYFETIARPTLLITVGISASIGFVAILQTYHYQIYQDYNPARFWFIFMVTNGIILVAILYASILNVINEHLLHSILMGFSPTALPAIGVFLGDAWRIIKGESSISNTI